jgi:hypothetical protein
MIVFTMGFWLGAVSAPSDGNHFVVGYTYSYVHGTDSSADFLVYKVDAAGNKLWRKNLGGENGDYIWSTSYTPTEDGGIVVAGQSDSYTHGADDVLVYRLSAGGAKLWRKNYGGSGFDCPNSVIQTADGGFLIVGFSDSYTIGDRDFLLYKITDSGGKQWRRTFGGGGGDYGYSAYQTSDGGYLVAGYTYSYGVTPGEASPAGGKDTSYSDFLVYRLSPSGAKLWRKNYGGADSDYGRAVTRLNDGHYIVAGDGYSYTHGSRDWLVYKLDGAGGKLWRKNYGGIEYERCFAVSPTADGGAILAGYGDSYTNGYHDFLIYKLDAAGAKQWRKNLGGGESDRAYVIYSTLDGGYFVLGETNSYHHGSDDSDLLIYKLNAAGAKLWRKNYGGIFNESGWD